MRINEDCTYREYKDGAEDAFRLFEIDNWPAEQVTDYLVEDDWHGDGLKGTSAFLWYISVATRELELKCLEDRVLFEISYHIPLYEKGEYHDLTTEEKELVDKDVAFIKSTATLIPADQLEEVEG